MPAKLTNNIIKMFGYNVLLILGSTVYQLLQNNQEKGREGKQREGQVHRHCNAINQSSGIPSNFFRGSQQIQLRTEGRENGDMGVVAP
jgi:hypothetical protein